MAEESSRERVLLFRATGGLRQILRSLTRRGRVPYYRVGRRVVYDRADLERLLAACRVPAEAERTAHTVSQ